MEKSLISELLGRKGVYPFLKYVYSKSDIIRSDEINELLEDLKLSDSLLSELVRFGLFIERSDGFYISSKGKKLTLLLSAINEDLDLSEVFNQLTYLYPSLRAYELITECVTDYFIDTIYSKPFFIRLYICSPWIRLDKDHLKKIKSAISAASSVYEKLQIFVITLPLDRYRDKNAIETLKALRSFGSEIVINRKLHAKLYISEPGPLGGSHFSIIGSENLTGRGNIELAIKIENDNDILRKLNSYFREIYIDSEILTEV